MGCGQSLILLPDTRVWCGSRTCPKPEAASALLSAQATADEASTGRDSNADNTYRVG
jgi:hypothetical protein